MSEGLEGALGELVAARFGGPCYAATHAGAVTGSNAFCTSNPDRVWLCFINIGADLGYLGFKENATSADGIPLQPNGGTLVFDAIADAVLPGFAWFMNNYAGLGSKILVIEVIRIHKIPKG